MGQGDGGTPRRSAIPLIAGAIVTAQLTMTFATYLGNHLTIRGCGRKPLLMAGLLTLPIRCALIILWEDAGDSWLLSTQILDGLGGGLFSLMHPYLVADITFGSGRFNLVMGFTASCFGYVTMRILGRWTNECDLTVLPCCICSLGATLSNFFGQMVVEQFGHTASLSGSLVISFIPIFIFAFMPETTGAREYNRKTDGDAPYRLSNHIT